MDDSISRIENALKVLAQLIETYGDAYWPLFERLEKELTARQSRQARLQKFLTTDSNLDFSKRISDEKLQ